MSMRMEVVVVRVSSACIVFAIALFAWDRWDEHRAQYRANRIIPAAATLAMRGFARGPEVAEHTVVIFTDFQCPFCRGFAALVDSVERARPNVRIVERHLPLVGIHPFAYRAAMTSECAFRQGRYREMRAVLFRQPRLIETERWGALAALARVADTSLLVSCVKSRSAASNVEADLKAAAALGLDGTPAVLIDSTLFGRVPDYSQIIRLTEPRR